MKDLHGQAIYDYYRGEDDKALILHNSYGEPEEMPVEVFFREEEDFSTLEHLALIECQGKVLDLGAGAGAHALVLQAKGFDVTALENSPGCVEVLKQSGMSNVIHTDYQKHLDKYDTVLALMNGLGLAGTLAGVPRFLEKCMDLLHPKGQLLIDSSDISYLYEDGLQKPSGYYGEIKYRYEYQDEKGDWFNWLYLDQDSLLKITTKMGLFAEILHTDEQDQYLARITRE
ncbi:bifunctional 2-polyprenyl-6-hydroxyphenol methylase/3-demethylubiquinol 3-O-methyltransferase UbiG [Marinoscillum sp. MHG1-6]|uniref:class I SAM-dependent methyltransferase n=1 Tax=Marinoscillum sp. MHG1-6 TaxID=2959627 RepID=UPI0021587D98|nr:methyltransferase domain-containing protein [Marinoscillum sp. MHG1-6]